MLTGQNGILNRAGEAKEKTEKETIKEQVQLQVLASLDERTELNLNTLSSKLKAIGAKVIADSFPVTAILNGYSYKINSNGIVEEQEKADRTGIKVGDYINFEPDTDYDEEGNSVAKTYPKEYLADEYTGVYQEYHNSLDLVQNSIKWQVLKIYEDGSIKLRGIERENAFLLKDATGYNNAVWILNDICEQMYSKKSVQITARSINLEDFEDDDYFLNENQGNWKNAKDKYINEQILTLGESNWIQSVDTLNKTVTYKTNFSYYPNLYAQEKYSGIDTSNLKEDGISRSEKAVLSRNFLDTSTESNARKQAKNNITVKYTGYEIEINNKNYGDAYSALCNGVYWIASRVTRCDSSTATFGIPRYVENNSKMQVVALCKSGKTGKGTAYGRVCPIVTLSPSVKIEPSNTASNSEGTPHFITNY